MTLGEHCVLPIDFAKHLAPIVGLRNRVVHKYEEIRLKDFLTQLRTERGDVPEYIRHVAAYIDRHGSVGNDRV